MLFQGSLFLPHRNTSPLLQALGFLALLIQTAQPTAQPAQVLPTSTAHIHIIVYILICNVMVILNVNMGRMRILMIARSSIKKIKSYQNMPPSDAGALCTP